ncbi:hypothetical protein T08_13442 [Trichinella sp. T8]|nr:hypothetical protein T08_13442 [Trichinella sp. T8]
MEKKEWRQITTAQKLQIIQTVDENPNMKCIEIARMMKIPSSRLNTVRRYVCSFNVDENVINQLSIIDTVVTSRRVRSLDLPPGLRQFVRRYCSSPTHLRSRDLFFVSSSSAFVPSLQLHSALVRLITAWIVSAASIYRSILPQGAPGWVS